MITTKWRKVGKADNSNVSILKSEKNVYFFVQLIESTELIFGLYHVYTECSVGKIQKHEIESFI